MTMVFELSGIDRHFSEFICKEAVGASATLKPVVSLVSHAVGDGNICLNLADVAGRDIQVDGEEVSIPVLYELQESLRRTSVVGSPGDYRPLILDGDGRLYLYRYWKYERDLARVILEKAAAPCGMVDEALSAKDCAGCSRTMKGRGPTGKEWLPWLRCGKNSASFPAARGPARPRQS